MHSIILISNGDMKFIAYNILLSRYYNVVVASSVQQALDLIDDGFKIDLIILSVGMKHRNGYELLMQIRMRQHAMHIPVMLFSETGFGMFKRGFLKIGEVYYIAKLQTYHSFMGKVREILKNDNIGYDNRDSLIKCAVSCNYINKFFCDDSGVSIRIH